MKRGIALLFVLTLAAPPLQAEEALLPKEAQELIAKGAHLKSYRTRFTLQAEDEDGKPVHLEGQILYEAPDRRHIELKEAESARLSQMLVSDGQMEWQFYPELNSVYRSKATPYSPGPHHPFNEVQSGTLRFIQSLGEGADLRYRFEAVPLPAVIEGSPIAIQTIRIDVGKEDGLVRGMYLVDDKGKVVLSQEYHDVEINIPIPKEEFTFVPPTGVAVVDVEPPAGSSEPSK